MTLAHLHLDRVASAWLIARQIDPGAEFSYLEWGAERPDPSEGFRLFGMPGLESLSSHDGEGTCFLKLLRAHGLEDDPSLRLLERVVAAGVANALGHDAPDGLDEDLRALGTGLDLLGTGFGVTADDDDHLRQAMPVYDALHVLCRTRTLPAQLQDQVPPLPGDRAAFLRDVLAA